MLDEAAIRDRVAEVIADHAGQEGPLLPMLHGIQEAVGYVPDSAVPLLAEALRTTTAEIHGVVTFYHDFKRAPQGRHTLKLCRAEACQAMGAAAQNEAILRQLGLDWGETSADGRLTVHGVYCLGLCACGPAAMVDDRLLGRLSAEGVAAAVEGLR